MSTLLCIDGSLGEGGGQIIRSSLALSMITGRPISIDKIRAGRDKPGLRTQHVTAVAAAAQLCRAKVSGLEIGSRKLSFEPGPVRPGEYHFRIGTAGSATLVLQTVLPALLVAQGSSQLTLEGGTHNPWAPPFDFLQRAFLPLVNRMGPKATATLIRHGFYPAGGGCFEVTIEPSSRLTGFDLLERGSVRSQNVRAMVSNLPEHIAAREVQTVLNQMGWETHCGRREAVDARGPGNVLLVEVVSDHVTEVFTAFGRRGVPAEAVAEEVVREIRDYLRTDAPVGPHLADQLILPFGISVWQADPPHRQRRGAFRTLPLTPHADTHIELVRQFLEIEIHVERSADGATRIVRIGG